MISKKLSRVKVTVSRKAHFNAAHRLHNPDLTAEENKELFGLCNNPNYHGHNYELIVSVTGEIDKKSGYVIDMKVLKQLIRDEVETPFDHKNLNLDTPEFQNMNPTAENIVVVIWNKLRVKINQSLALKVTLYETPRNFVSYSGE